MSRKNQGSGLAGDTNSASVNPKKSHTARLMAVMDGYDDFSSAFASGLAITPLSKESIRRPGHLKPSKG